MTFMMPTAHVASTYNLPLRTQTTNSNRNQHAHAGRRMALIMQTQTCLRRGSLTETCALMAVENKGAPSHSAQR